MCEFVAVWESLESCEDTGIPQKSFRIVPVDLCPIFDYCRHIKLNLE